MEGVIDAYAPLDYAEFHIIPSQNRYEASVYSGRIVETLASGLLEQLSRYLPKANDLYLKGSNINFKLHPPRNLGDAKWFTKSTLTRFLHMVASADMLNITNTIGNEISLLEESRNFHLSLYAKGHQDQFGSGKTDGNNGSGKPESDASKNELLQAMDLRLSALRGELASAFSRAAGATCSPKEISDLERFSQYFGATELRNCLCKFMELSQRSQAVDFPSKDKFLSTHDSSSYSVSTTEWSSDISKPSQSDKPVKYGVSPAKVAQVERESSTEGEDSSHSSEEDQQFGERSSRTLIRSASPRRSASPMRRVQIGRSGSRRATALTIKSLSSLPTREKTFAHTDAESEEEGSEQPPKKPESRIRRMSVQDAISLFESKQRDQTEDTQKRSSILDTSVSVTANKSVLRRWSSGIAEGSAQSLPENVSESSVQMSPKNSGVEENPKSSIEEKPESDLVSGGEILVATVSVKVDTPEKSTEKLTASAEWTQQKEAELNQMLMKMMESKPAIYQNAIPDSYINQNVPSEQRGGFYNHYKEKRDEKLRGETAGKKSEKEAQFRAMQKIINQRKAEMASSNVTNADKKQTPGKSQKPNKTLSQSANPKKETSKPAVTKKTVSKASPLPPTRKSWPSTPPPRSTGISPAKTPSGISSAGTTPTRRKPQPAGPAPSVTRSNPKVERTQQRPKSVKPTQNDFNKIMKGMNEKKKQAVPKNGKTVKTKEQTPSGDLSSTGPTKPSFYSKVTKKSSVVPLESKPFLRKGSGIGPGVGATVLKTKVSSQPEESLRISEDLTQAQENEMVINTSDPISQQEEMVLEEMESHVHLESETQTDSLFDSQLDNNEQNYAHTESSDTANGDDSFKRMPEELSLKTVAEEESIIISPSAWVEIEEHQDPPISSPSNIAPVAISSPRVRHSLSQMLLEESSEPDIIEWGNAENPPSMVYQKDAPKGLKRLLKFARKSRTDANITGWSSPSAFSEGEDDAEESKAFGRKNGDNLLRKATLHAKNYGQQKTSSFEGYEKNSATHELLSAQSNIGKFTAHKLQEGHVSASATASKATRSFFSLSAFRGSK